MIPLLPTATVKLRNRISTARAFPPKSATTNKTMQIAGQYEGHAIQSELPRERLRPSRQVPQSRPERSRAHCELLPLSIFKLINTPLFGGWQ